MTSPDDVREALEEVYDPEIGVDIVNLGLVYDVEVDEKNYATIHMTLTSAACPLTDEIEAQIQDVLVAGGVVTWVTIQWVWTPTWQTSMVTPFGREMLQAMGLRL